MESFIWIMFVIFAGQLGTIINVIKRYIFGDWEFLPSFGPDTAAGSFYTFALVLTASLVAPIFWRFIKKEEPEYRNISIIFVTLLIFLILLCAVFYSFATNDINSVDFSKLRNENIVIDWKQLIFFGLSLLLAWYSFGLSLLPTHESELQLDDYQSKDDKEREKLSKSVNPITSNVSESKEDQPQVNLQHSSANTNYGDIEV